VIGPALGAGGFESTEGQLLTAGAFEHSSLWAPSVDLTHLYVFYLIVSVEALEQFRHTAVFLSLSYELRYPKEAIGLS
jgi:hypothetical protein